MGKLFANTASIGSRTIYITIQVPREGFIFCVDIHSRARTSSIFAIVYLLLLLSSLGLLRHRHTLHVSLKRFFFFLYAVTVEAPFLH